MPKTAFESINKILFAPRDGKDLVPDTFFKTGPCFDVKGYRDFTKVLRYMDTLFHKHGIQVTITELEMISSPYIGFRMDSVKSSCLILAFLKEEKIDFVWSCSCKGQKKKWEELQACPDYWAWQRTKEEEKRHVKDN